MRRAGEYYCTECGWLNRDEVNHAIDPPTAPALCGYCDKPVKHALELGYPEQEQA